MTNREELELFVTRLAAILKCDANLEKIEESVLQLLEPNLAYNQLSDRGQEWLCFSDSVLTHVENYTVPQYGDKGSDNVTEYTPEECILQSKKYAARFGRNQRDGQQLLDLIKSAHYNCLAWTKLQER